MLISLMSQSGVKNWDAEVQKLERGINGYWKETAPIENSFRQSYC